MYINNCETCQQAKYDRNPTKPKFKLTLTSFRPFESIHLDVFQAENQKFLTIIDNFSRYCQAYHIAGANAISVTSNLIKFISHHGVPHKITTDGGTEFNNTTLKEFTKLHRIQFHVTTPNNSNSNSPVERLHSTLLEHLRCLRLTDKTTPISELITHAVLAYNNSIHSVTKQTPFNIINGHTQCLDPFDITETQIVNDYINKHREKTKILYENIQKLSQNVKEKVITKRNESREEPIDYPEDTPVYIKTHKRVKMKPKFKKATLLENLDVKAKLKTGLVHKKNLKRPKKRLKANPLLQEPDNDITHKTTNAPRPSGSPEPSTSKN